MKDSDCVKQDLSENAVTAKKSTSSVHMRIKTRLAIAAVTVYIIVFSSVVGYHLHQLEGLATQYKENLKLYNTGYRKEHLSSINHTIASLIQEQLLAENNFTILADKLNATVLLRDVESEYHKRYILDIMTNLSNIQSRVQLETTETQKLKNQATNAKFERAQMRYLLHDTTSKFTEVYESMNNASLQLQQYTSDIENDIALLKSRVNLEILEQNQVVTSLESAKKEIDTISGSINDTNTNIDEVKANQTVASGDIKAALNSIDNYHNDLEEVVKTADPVISRGKVGFVATMEKTTYKSIGKIPLNHVMIDLGGHYDTSAYTFRVPKDGIYLYAYSLRSGPLINNGSEYRSAAYLMKNTDIIASSQTVITSSIYSHEDQAGNLVIVHCSQGDEVYLETRDTDNCIFAKNYGESTFTGVLLYQDV